MRLIGKLGIIFFIFTVAALSHEAKFSNLYFSAKTTEYYQTQEKIVASGGVILIYENYYLTAEKLIYDLKSDQIWAEGNVNLKDQTGQAINTSKIILKANVKLGVINDFAMRFKDNSLLAANLAERLDENHLKLKYVVYSPCKINCTNYPLWQIKAKSAEVNFESHKVTYQHVYFEIVGIPVAYIPYFFHSTPDAPATSGILVPSMVKNALAIPLYLRIKPNIDITFTPKISNEYIIFETELRHRLHNGVYNVNLSYGQIPCESSNILTHKDHNVEKRYYLSSQAYFNNDHNHYGFDINAASDKAYLAKYYNIYPSYLTSQIYFNYINNYDYLSLTTFKFHNLQFKGETNNHQIILPRIHSRNIFEISEFTDFIIENDLLHYHDTFKDNLGRASSEITATHNLIFQNGILMDIALRTRLDTYCISQFNNKNNKHGNLDNSIIMRAIPEIETKLKYPLISESFSTFFLEPIIMFTAGRKEQLIDQKFRFIDAINYSFNESNLFIANRFSGIEKHNFGQRLNIGINAATTFKETYIDLIFGKYYQFNAVDPFNLHYTGKTSAFFLGNNEVFYRFNLDKSFNLIESEIGIRSTYNSLSGIVSYLNLEAPNQQTLNNLTIPNLIQSKNTKQLIFSIDFKINDNWLVGNETNLMLSEKSKQLVYKNFKVTYIGDCVSITLKFYNNKMTDATQGIKPHNSVSFSLGLKTLNF